MCEEVSLLQLILLSVLSANCICGVGKILNEEWENAFCKL